MSGRNCKIWNVSVNLSSGKILLLESVFSVHYHNLSYPMAALIAIVGRDHWSRCGTCDFLLRGQGNFMWHCNSCGDVCYLQPWSYWCRWMVNFLVWPAFCCWLQISCLAHGGRKNKTPAGRSRIGLEKPYVRKAWPVAGRGLAVHHRSSMFIRWKHETQPCQAFCLSLSNTLTLWDWTWDTGTRKTSLEVGVSVLHICAGVGPAFARPSTWCAPLHDRMQKWFFSNQTQQTPEVLGRWFGEYLTTYRVNVIGVLWKMWKASAFQDIFSGLIRPRLPHAASLLGSSGADTPWTLLRRPTVMLCGWPTSAATKGGRPPSSTVQSAQVIQARRP